jgi:hypothetical protein
MKSYATLIFLSAVPDHRQFMNERHLPRTGGRSRVKP